PQVIAIRKLREAASFRAADEAVESAEGDVLRPGQAAPSAAEFLSGQADQALEVALPQWLGGRGGAPAELIDPGRDAAGRGHGRWSPRTREFTDRRPDGTPGVW